MGSTPSKNELKIRQDAMKAARELFKSDNKKQAPKKQVPKKQVPKKKKTKTKK